MSTINNNKSLKLKLKTGNMKVSVYFIVSISEFVASSLIGHELNSIRRTKTGSLIPFTINSNTNINDSPVLNKPVSIQNAKYYTNLAGAAICQDEKIIEFTCEPYCKDAVEGTESTPPTSKVQVYVIMRDILFGIKGYLGVIPERKEIVLSFAGERPNSNRVFSAVFQLKNINVDYSYNNNTGIATEAVSVHKFLYNTAERLIEQCSDQLAELLNKYEDYKVTFTGHSIGSEASLFSTIIAHHKFDIPWKRIRYIGYGSLRAGNREFAKWYNQQGLESSFVINYSEKLVHLFRTTFNYQYVGNEIFIQKDGSPRYCDNKYFEDPKCNINEIDLDFKESHIHAFDTTFGLVC